jgi:uncharacterized membrane protein YhaH (DUF805 family)
MKKEVDFNLIDWWKKVVLENYANFEGRARRAEYWNFILTNFLGYISLFIFAFIPVIGLIAGVGYIVLAFGVIIPSIAVLVRRLHDRNKSGWFYFVALIPIIGSIWLLIELCSEGTIGNNQYGADPKRPTDNIKEIGVKQE